MGIDKLQGSQGEPQRERQESISRRGFLKGLAAAGASAAMAGALTEKAFAGNENGSESNNETPKELQEYLDKKARELDTIHKWLMKQVREWMTNFPKMFDSSAKDHMKLLGLCHLCGILLVNY